MLAIIPARGGSKGLPGKNIRMLDNKPLIAHTIHAAQQSKSISRIIVSTDDQQIADVARTCGAEVPFLRPAHLAQDNSAAIDNYIYTMERLNQEAAALYEDFVVLLPTVPLRSAQDIDHAVKLFLDKKADSVISCTSLPYPLEWVFEVNEQGVIHKLSSSDLSNRQEARHRYIPNGAVYVFKFSFLKDRRTYYSDRTYAYMMPPERSIDIDVALDLKFAEFLIHEQSR